MTQLKTYLFQKNSKHSGVACPESLSFAVFRDCFICLFFIPGVISGFVITSNVYATLSFLFHMTFTFPNCPLATESKYFPVTIFVTFLFAKLTISHESEFCFLSVNIVCLQFVDMNLSNSVLFICLFSAIFRVAVSLIQHFIRKLFLEFSIWGFVRLFEAQF